MEETLLIEEELELLIHLVEEYKVQFENINEPYEADMLDNCEFTIRKLKTLKCRKYGE